MKATKFWFIIESRINAQETGNQSDRYVQIEKKQNIPIKYIYLKPDYNHHKLQNQKFVEFSYSKLLKILKEIKYCNLSKAETFISNKSLGNIVVASRFNKDSNAFFSSREYSLSFPKIKDIISNIESLLTSLSFKYPIFLALSISS